MVKLTPKEFEQTRELLMSIDDGTTSTSNCHENPSANCLQLRSSPADAAKIIDLIAKKGTNWVASSPGEPPFPLKLSTPPPTKN